MFGLGESVPEVEATTVMDSISKKEKVGLLDVRTPQEYSRGNIRESVNIPVEKVSEDVEEAFPDKELTIYVYCLSGSRSVVAVSQMIKMGYKNVFSLTSGLLSWRSKQYPLSID